MTDREISKPEPIELYELRQWDGGDGRTNMSTGLIVQSKELAEQWAKENNGSDYRSMVGVLVQRLEDIPAAQIVRAGQKALAKLTDEEKKALGL